MRTASKTMRKVTLLLAAMALAVLLAALPAQAATTFTVNAVLASAASVVVDGVCDSNTEEAGNQCTLRAAIQEANVQANAQANDQEVADVINVPAGTYTLTIPRGAETYQTPSTATGDLNITEALTINGAGPASTTVEGGAGFDDKIFNNHKDVSTTITGLTITGGSASSDAGGGGGIYNNGGDLKVSNTTLTGNTAWRGAGIYNDFGTLALSDTIISGNTATGDYSGGGGIENLLGTLTVSDSTISNNTADKSDNTTDQGWGGGIASYTSEDLTTSKTTITNSTISGNTAESGGGGVSNDGGLTEIEHSTITNNSAPSGWGSGVGSWGGENYLTRTDVLSSIISANTYTDNTTGTDKGTDVDLVGGNQNSLLSEGYNLIGDGNATAAFNKSGDKKGVADPGLDPLSLNTPGSTKTHALKATSPAINAGAPVSECPATDQRGFDRPQENRCDIGSFERQVTPPSVTKVVLLENATGIAPGVNVSAVSSEAMRATSVKSAFKLYKKGSTTAIRRALPPLSGQQSPTMRLPRGRC